MMRALGTGAVTRAVERTAWALVAVGLVMAMLPARATVPNSRANASTPTTIASPPEVTPDDAWLAANPFAVSRRAPSTRWLPNDTAPPPDPPGVDGAAAALVPTLFGTMVGPGGDMALMRLDAANPAARLYLAGERGGAYVVRRILDDRVILDGPSGRIELRLRRGEARP